MGATATKQTPKEAKAAPWLELSSIFIARILMYGPGASLSLASQIVL